MEIDFIPTEWSAAEHLGYVVELVESMDVTREQRIEIIQAWGGFYGVSIEGVELKSEE